jgi:hypothetical protein
MKCNFIEKPKEDVQMATLVTNSILTDEEMNAINGGGATECGTYVLCNSCAERTGKRSCTEYIDDIISCGTYKHFLTYQNIIAIM